MFSNSSDTPIDAWKVLEDSSNNAAHQHPVVATKAMVKQLVGLRNALQCPLCERMYQAPVVTTLACGHSFCQACIDEYTCNSYTCPVKECGSSIMVTGKNTGSYRKINPSLQTAVNSVSNIVEALSKAKPEWWKEGSSSSKELNESGDSDEIDLQATSRPTTGGMSDAQDDNHNDNDDETIDLQADQNDEKETLPQEDGDDDDDDDETVFETALS